MLNSCSAAGWRVVSCWFEKKDKKDVELWASRLRFLSFFFPENYTCIMKHPLVEWVQKKG